MKAGRPKRPTTLIGRSIAALFAFAFVGVISSCVIAIGIWPGEIKLLAPVFCSDAQPDAFVVADTYSPRPGETVTNFSLYCMGSRGDATDHGFLRPFLAISVLNGVLIFAIMFLLGRATRTRRRALMARAKTQLTGGAPVDSDGNLIVLGYDLGDADVEQGSPFDISGDGKRTPPNPGSTAGPFVD